jgi:hypothetical protein
METLFNQAALLNNEGVLALMQGRQREAFGALSKSVMVLKALVSERVTSGAPTGNFDSSSSSRMSNDAACCIQTVALPSSQYSTQSVSYLYDQVFTLPQGFQCLHPPRSLNDDDVRAYTAAVIFNLALIHHRNSSVVKAEKLYTLACALLADPYPINSCPYMACLVAMVQIASINNVSQIRFDCGDYEATREALADMSRILRHGADLSVLQDPNLQGFVLNILLFKASSTAAAA